MTAVHQLESTLRSLKLGGMLDTLEVRLVQARAGELGHQEFLQVLCEDELNRRAATAVTRRVRAARFEEQVTLEDFDFTVSAKLPVHAIRDLATLRFLERAESVALHGRDREEPRRPSTGEPGLPAEPVGHVPQDQQGPRAPGGWARRPDLECPAAQARERRPADPGRFRRPNVHRRPSRRPLRARHRTSRPVRRSTPPTGHPRTGIRCSRTPSLPSHCSTGSSTPVTSCSWTDRATALERGPLACRPTARRSSLTNLQQRTPWGIA